MGRVSRFPSPPRRAITIFRTCPVIPGHAVLTSPFRSTKTYNEMLSMTFFVVVVVIVVFVYGCGPFHYPESSWEKKIHFWKKRFKSLFKGRKKVSFLIYFLLERFCFTVLPIADSCIHIQIIVWTIDFYSFGFFFFQLEFFFFANL